MARRGTPFTGIIFAGLMLTQDGPQLIEYNVRLGDPEAQALLIRLQSDLLAALAAVAAGRLDRTDIRFSTQSSISVVMAARGYPGKPVTGGVIRNIEAAEALSDVHVFQAGTKLDSRGEIVAAGGRVLSVCATGDTLAQARERAYAAVKVIDWPDGIYRHDIGQRALSARD